jgi:hypothetical protein
LSIVTAAAGWAGLALPAYIIRAGLDRAEHRAAPISEVQREALAELIRASGLVRRIDTNLNQAVARLHATGVPGPDLGPAAAYCTRVADRIDEAASQIHRRLKQQPGPTSPRGSTGLRRRTPLSRSRPPSLTRPRGLSRPEPAVPVFWPSHWTDHDYRGSHRAVGARE